MTDETQPGRLTPDEAQDQLDVLLAGNVADAQRVDEQNDVIEINDPEISDAPVEQLTPAEQARLADHIIDEIDDHPEGIPMLPLNLTNLYVWSIESCFMPPVGNEEPEPGVIVTIASPDNPRGTPFVLTRDRALKFASQVKKFAHTGPSIQVRAAQSGLAVPQDAGEKKLILPGQ